MQNRSSLSVGEDNSNASLLPRSQYNKREWPQKLLRCLLFFILLGSGILIGVVISSHLTYYLGSRESNYTLFYPPFVSPSPPCNLKKEEEKVKLPVKLDDWIKPSSSMHNMTDDELLWRASMVPLRKDYPFRVPKVAFMFLTKGPIPLMPLWEKFFHGYQGLYSIYVHSLPDYKLKTSPSSPFYNRQIPSKVAEWGRMSMCDAERRLLANALLDFSNNRFILLSETCIPLFNFTTVYKYLIMSRHSFVSAFDDHGPYGRGRYNKNMEPEVTIDQWRKGSQWFEVNRKLAVNIVADDIYYPKFEKFCTPACYVDEHYFPTMLSIGFGSLIANRSITWVDWSRGGSHPGMFGKGDIREDFIGRIRNGPSCIYNNQTTHICHLFARKFAPSALDPLLQLSKKVMGFG